MADPLFKRVITYGKRNPICHQFFSISLVFYASYLAKIKKSTGYMSYSSFDLFKREEQLFGHSS